MIAKTVEFDLSLVLLILAVALFVLSAVPKLARAWMMPVGLACFSGAFLADRLL
jgi:uncharacterized membrane protein YgdD (TMEM256/DUF423 family)